MVLGKSSSGGGGRKCHTDETDEKTGEGLPTSLRQSKGKQRMGENICRLRRTEFFFKEREKQETMIYNVTENWAQGRLGGNRCELLQAILIEMLIFIIKEILLLLILHIGFCKTLTEIYVDVH